ncbi:SDR family oxidoreductase [Glaciibacter sp. 2TAF33]|uniref:SDR family oxidoreductase n=1 Tax=Glaciibacter sp. 2TAF33 TaxID=3233015 RepID=UPI003F8FDAC3
MATIAITGVTGHVGGRIIRQLAGEDPAAALVLIARNPARVPAIPGTETALAEYGDSAAVESALARSDVLFMVSAHEAADRLEQHRTFIAAAARAGVQHIVYTSFVGAGHSAGFTLARDHGATEEAIRDTGLDYTFLRDNFYLDVLLEFADENGVIRGPAGDGVTAAVARADVADAAVAVLKHPEEHRKTVYELTGREAIGLAELARRASVATGRPFSFVDETMDEAHASRAHYGAPDWQVDAWVSTYTAIRDGELARVSGDVRKLTGNEPRTLEDVIIGIP